jgi:hypothetical protein
MRRGYSKIFSISRLASKIVACMLAVQTVKDSEMTVTTDLIGIGYMLSIAADKANLIDLADNTPFKERLATVEAFLNALDDLHNHASTISNNLAGAIENGAK